MSVDIGVKFPDRMPTKDEVETIFTALYGDILKSAVKEEWGWKLHFGPAPPVPLPVVFTEQIVHESEREDYRRLLFRPCFATDRVIELWHFTDHKSILLTLRAQDELVIRLAEALATVLARYFKGSVSS